MGWRRRVAGSGGSCMLDDELCPTCEKPQDPVNRTDKLKWWSIIPYSDYGRYIHLPLLVVVGAINVSTCHNHRISHLTPLAIGKPFSFHHTGSLYPTLPRLFGSESPTYPLSRAHVSFHHARHTEGPINAKRKQSRISPCIIRIPTSSDNPSQPPYPP